MFYTQSGSFVQYLVDRFSMDQFKRFYNPADGDGYKSSFQDTCGADISDVYADWLLGLQTGRLK